MTVSPRSIIIFCASITLLINVFLSLTRTPAFLTIAALSLRDVILILLAFTWPVLIRNRIASRYAMTAYFIYFFTILAFAIQLILLRNYAPILNSIALSRIVLALPILCILFCIIWPKDQLEDNSFIEKIFKVFLTLCLIESIFLILGLYPFYLDLIGFDNYMDSKNTSSGIAFGFFGYRLITPLFNASVGGVILSFLFGFYWLSGQKRLAIITLIPLILTVSKSGFVVAIIFILSNSFSAFGFFFACIAYFIMAIFSLNNLISDSQFSDNILIHLSSIDYHVRGLITGMDRLLLPVGLGNAGTVPGVEMPELIGRESGIGVGLGTSGLFYLITFVVSAFALIREFGRVGFLMVFGYTLVALMNEGASSFYIWVPLFLLFFKSSQKYNFKLR